MSLSRQFSQLASVAALSQAIPMLMAPWLTRQFDPASIGHWALFAALAANLATVCNLRYEYAVLLPRRQAEAGLLLELALWVAALMGLLATGLGLLLLWAPLSLPGRLGGLSALYPSMLALGPVVALAGLQQAMTLWANRLGHFGLIAQARLWQQGGLAAAQAAVMLWGWTSTAALVMAQLFSSFLAPLWMRGRGARQLRRAGRSAPARRRHVRHLWRLALRYREFPLVNSPHAFINALQDTVVLALISHWAGPEQAGYYAVMVRLVKAPASLMGGALSEVLLSTLAGDWRAGLSLKPRLRRSLWVLLGVAVPGMMILVAVGPTLFAWVLGEDWRESGSLAQAFAPYVAAHFVAAPLTVIPMVTGRQKGALMFSVVGNALYIAAVAGGLLLGGSLVWGLAAVSLLLPIYFVVLLAWIWQGATPPASSAVQRGMS